MYDIVSEIKIYTPTSLSEQVSQFHKFGITPIHVYVEKLNLSYHTPRV